MFVRQGDSGSEMEDDTQLKFFTEHRGRRRSRGLRDKQLLVEMISSACVLQSQSSITSFQNGPLRIYDDAHSRTSEETLITVHTDIAFRPLHCTW
ncbi:hypothetical protein PO909_025099 [Leuciscus waleckii]